MRAWLVLVALAVLPAALCAQGFEVAGRVVDGVTGGPLAYAAIDMEPLNDELEGAVAARGPGGGAAPKALAGVTTGPDGRFAFAGVPAGRYILSASRRGYLAANLDQHDNFYAALVVGGAGATRIRFALQPLAAIEGTILDSSGDPVQIATASLFLRSLDGSGKVRQRQSDSVQPGGSSFAFDNLAPGTYYIAVTGRPWFAENHASEGGAPDPLDAVYPATFFDGASSAVSAQPIVLKAGEIAQANFSLHAVPAVHVKIAVQQERGAFYMPQLSQTAFDGSLPLGTGLGANRMARQPGETTLGMAISVAPGTYTVQRGGETSSIDATTDTVLSEGVAASAPVRLTGKLAMADGSALPSGLALHLLPNGSGRVRFQGFRGGFRGEFHGGGGAGFGQRQTDVALNADGGFSTDAVPAGDYRLSIAAGGGGAAVVTDAAATGARISEESDSLVLHVGADPVMLAATVALANGTVSGRVLAAGGAAASGAMVLLVPSGSSPGLGSAAPEAMLYRQDESDSDGTWTIYGVVPGTYRAVAIHDGWDLAWRKPEVLARYLAAGSETVTVPNGGLAALGRPLPELAR